MAGDLGRLVAVGLAVAALGSGGGTAAAEVTKVVAKVAHGHGTVAARPAPHWGSGQADEKVTDPTGSGGRITRRMLAVYEAMKAQGYASHPMGCWDRHEWNPSSDHPRGRACDFGFNYQSASDVRRGWTAARWLVAHADSYDIHYVIWQDKSWSTDRPFWKPYVSSVYGCPDSHNTTGCHMDHIHVSVK